MTDALRAPRDDKDPATWSEEEEWQQGRFAEKWNVSTDL